MRVQYSIILVSDMERSINFYRDIIGMPLKFQSPGWTEFATEGATWALHKAENRKEQSDFQGRESAGQCRPGFQVSQLDDFHSKMIDNKVPCVQVPTSTFGVRIAQYVDPDGLHFSVSEQRPIK